MSFYADPEHVERLTTLAAGTRIRQAEFLREALADVLKKYEAKLAEIDSRKGRAPRK